MLKKIIQLLIVCMLITTISFAAKTGPVFPDQKQSNKVQPLFECETFSFTPSCRTTPGTITVCGATNLWETFWALVGAAMETEAAACPPEDMDPFSNPMGHMYW